MFGTEYWYSGKERCGERDSAKSNNFCKRRKGIKCVYIMTVEKFRVDGGEER
jgi:hypothetical protein